MRVAVSWMYSELRPKVDNLSSHFEQQLRLCNRASIIKLCSLFNAHVAKGFGGTTLDYLRPLNQAAFKPELADDLNSRLDSSPARATFHRAQLLFLMRRSLELCTDDGAALEDLPYLGSFGDLCLMSNELLYHELPEGDEGGPQERLLLNGVPSIELQRVSVKSQMVRAARIAEIMESLRNEEDFKQFIDIPGLFEQNYSCSLAEYRAVAVAIAMKYIALEVEPFDTSNCGSPSLAAAIQSVALEKEYLSNISINGDKLASIFRLLSALPGDVQTIAAKAFGVFDADVLRKFPLINIEGKYFITDIGFLLDKLEVGPFWAVRAILNDKKDQRRALAFWGAVYERYISWVLKHSTSSPKNDFFPNTHWGDDGNFAVDIVLRWNRFFVFIETKGGFLPARAKYSGNLDLLRESIEEKFVRTNDGREMGVEQLATAIKNIFRSTDPRTLKEVSCAGALRVYPVLVIREEFSAAPMFNRMLNQEFRKSLQGETLSAQVMPLICLPNSGVEQISHFLKGIPMSDILDDYLRSNRQLGLGFWMVTIDCLKDRTEPEDSLTNREFLRISGESARQLFPAESLENENSPGAPS